ncbi:MAG: hypothetical protein WC528_02565 [Patescibacteria group bacterium]
MKKIIILLLLSILLGGCSISFSTNKKSNLGFYRSDTAGETWQSKNIIGQSGKKILTISSLNVIRIIKNPHNEETIYLTAVGKGIYKSENRGESWKSLNLGDITYANLIFDPEDKDIMYTATGGKILKTVDAGANWQTIYIETMSDNIINDIAVDHYDGKRVYALTSRGSFLESDDYGVTWQVKKWFKESLQKIYLDPSDSRILYLLTSGYGFYRSYDRGNSWELISESLKKIDPSLTITDFVIFPTNPKIIFLSTTFGILKTEDRGDNFSTITTLVSTPNTLDTFAVDPVNSQIIYFTRDNKLNKSINGGVEWKTILLPISDAVSDLLVEKSDANIIYLGVKKVNKK